VVLISGSTSIESDGYLEQETRERLKQEYEQTNPGELLRQIRALLGRLEGM